MREKPITLDNTIRELHKLNALEKKVKARKDEVRSDLFEFGTLSYDGAEHLRPTTTVTVPQEFWEKTGLTESEFLATRFPTWEVEAAEYDDLAGETTFILRKLPEFLPYKYENEDYKLSYVATEPTPDIDWVTLGAERPDLFHKLAKPVTTFVLDEDKLVAMLEGEPEIIAVLTRHTHYSREPQKRVTIKEIPSE